jgi:hypothetical protein
MTTNPKAVNIIHPFNVSSSPSLFSTSPLFQQRQQPNTVVSSIIRQPSNENHPGLSFFCQQKETIQNNRTTTTVEPIVEQREQHKPLVISRVNLPHRRPSSSSSSSLDIDEEDTKNNTTGTLNKPPSPAFGILGASLGSFLLRGIHQAKSNQQQLDEARVYRKIEDLEIEKNSLLTLNQTLESVVQQQSNTISDLQNRLAAIERPLTPGLDTTTSKNGIMSSTSTGIVLESNDIVKYLEEEEEAFDRVRSMLLNLIEQAQTAVTEDPVIPPLPPVPKRTTNNNGRKSTTPTIEKKSTGRVLSRRTSVGSNIIHSPSTSPIPNSRYPLQQQQQQQQRSPKYTQSTLSNSSKSARPKSLHLSTSNSSSSFSAKKWLN